MSAASGAEKEKIFDPYRYHVEMPLTAVYYPLGFPLRVKTNSAEVLEAAAECWGAYKQLFDFPSLELQIGVVDDGSTKCPPSSVPRARGHLMVNVCDSGNFFVADLLKGFSFAWLTTATVSHKGYFRLHFLNAMALSHIGTLRTAPIHGACVGLNGRGVMLCGDPGAGKSSLSFACARAGWSYTTDDASFLLLGRDDRRVVGQCHSIRLRPSAADLFAEVAGRPLIPRLTGKPSIEIDIAEFPAIQTAIATDVDFMVYLNRAAGGEQELVPFPKEAATRYINKHLSGVPELRAKQDAAVDRLLTAGIYEMRYRDMDWAIDRLERLVREGE